MITWLVAQLAAELMTAVTTMAAIFRMVSSYGLVTHSCATIAHGEGEVPYQGKNASTLHNSYYRHTTKIIR